MVLLQALLTAYIPYLTIDCTAELVLFRPNIGNVLGEQQKRKQLASWRLVHHNAEQHSVSAYAVLTLHSVIDTLLLAAYPCTNGW
jgi:hypothetical protein